MKGRIVLLTVVVLSLILLAGCGQGKFMPKPNEELYGTWTNERMPQQRSVITAHVFKTYNYMSDASTWLEGTMQIVGKSTDSKGNIWYKTFEIYTSGLHGCKGQKRQTLYELSKSGTVLECQPALVGDFDPKSFPDKFDPRDDLYRIYFRSEK